MNQFAKWKMGMAMWFGTMLFVFLGMVVFYANISSEAKVAVVMTLVTVFSSIMYAYWRKTSTEEKINLDAYKTTPPPTEPPKANGTVVVAPPVVPPESEPVVEEPEETIEPIPFNEAQFRADVSAGVANDYAGVVDESTIFYEARDKTRYRWAEQGKLNNTEAVRDMWRVIVDLAKKRMAVVWSGIINQPVAQEFITDPIKYVNDHFADFRNCPSCKQPVGNQLVDIKWLALNLAENKSYTPYLDLIDAQENLLNIDMLLINQ